MAYIFFKIIYDFFNIIRYKISKVKTFKMLNRLPLAALKKEKRLKFQVVTQKQDAILSISSCCLSAILSQIIQ